MATVKYSRQREAIKNFLMSRKDHPTAEVVYEHVLKAFPNISLGTVYRNLSFLVDNGQAVKVPCEDGSVHFDGNVMPHYHFQCTECGAIIDLDFDGSEESDSSVLPPPAISTDRLRATSLSFTENALPAHIKTSSKRFFKILIKYQISFM